MKHLGLFSGSAMRLLCETVSRPNGLATALYFEWHWSHVDRGEARCEVCVAVRAEIQTAARERETRRVWGRARRST